MRPEPAATQSAHGPTPHAAYECRRFGGVAWWSDRCGGVSVDPYRSCNVAGHVGDDPDAVVANRDLLASALGATPAGRWVTLDQVHGASVVAVDGPSPNPPVADAAITSEVGLPIVVMTADCAPIALLAPGAVGVVHAGWPGLLAGVIGEAVDRLREIGAGGPVHACLGPCIRPDNYEFGTDDLARFVDRFGDQAAARTSWGTAALDIPGLVRRQLADAGVDSFEDSGICTYADRHCFSHRRDGRTGRQALVVVRSNPPVGDRV